MEKLRIMNMTLVSILLTQPPALLLLLVAAVLVALLLMMLPEKRRGNLDAWEFDPVAAAMEEAAPTTAARKAAVVEVVVVVARAKAALLPVDRGLSLQRISQCREKRHFLNPYPLTYLCNRTRYCNLLRRKMATVVGLYTADGRPTPQHPLPSKADDLLEHSPTSILKFQGLTTVRSQGPRQGITRWETQSCRCLAAAVA